MCGIVSIFVYHYAAPPVDRGELRRTRDFMAARGPDGEGEWYSRDGRVGLGHRRLSIIDLSEAGAQPMEGPGGLVVTFNGEIYNYRQLRAELEARGRVFRSQSDTEVLLHLYEEKGEAMVRDLRGMFAFALWDARRGVMLLARDPYGIKPLYYADDGWTLRAASQVRALLAGRKVSRTPDPAGAAGFFLLGSVPEPFTLYQGIRAVPAGSVVRVGPLGASEPEPYFSVAGAFRDALARAERLEGEALQERVRACLLDSVRHHLVADVPVGAFLSAGVDSGALVGLARDAGAEGLRTITLAFEEWRGDARDEAPLARLVADRYGAHHTTRVLSAEEFAADLPRAIAAMDQPSVDGTNVYFISKAAAEQGLKVALSGLGGDELFGGYSNFRAVPRWARRLRAPGLVPGLGRLVRSAVSRAGPAGVTPKLAGLVEYGGSYPGAYLLRRGLFMPWELAGLLGEEAAEEGLRRLRPLSYIGAALRPDPTTPFARVAALEASLYMRNQLLRDADWAGMAHSLEIRVPLVDARLLEALAPALVAQNGSLDGKRLMARAPALPLPEEVSGREKTGFVVPIGAWLERAPGLDDWRRLPESLMRGHWSRRWAYVIYSRLSEEG